MTQKNVYLAGPIANCTFDEATNWRDYVCANLAPGVKGVSPMRLKDWCARIEKIETVDQYRRVTSEEEFLLSGESHAICARDMFDVMNCDMVLMYLPKAMNERRPSWGTAIELGWASAFRKPIVLVTDDDKLAMHPLARESVGWIVPNLNMGIDAVNSVLSVYAGV